MRSQKKTAYVTMNDEEGFRDSSELDELDEPKQIKQQPPHRLRRQVILYVSIGIATITTIFLIYHKFGTPKTIEQCGTTPAEAKAKGCIFEMPGFSWLPKECVDSEVEAEFLKFKNLQYYRDANYTDEVSIEEVKRGDGPGFYVKQDYHAAHCAFLFKKLHRALDAGRKVDGLIHSVEHTGHCVHMLLAPPDFRWDAVQFAFTKFPYCGKRGGYNVEWSKQGEWIN